MLNFDSIMRFASEKATYNAAQRIVNIEEGALSESLSDEMREVIRQNRVNLIIVEEMVKSGLEEYHRALEQESRRQNRMNL